MYRKNSRVSINSSRRRFDRAAGLVAQLCNREAAIIIRIFGKYIYLMNAFYFYLYIVLCEKDSCYLRKKDSLLCFGEVTTRRSGNGTADLFAGDDVVFLFLHL